MTNSKADLTRFLQALDKELTYDVAVVCLGGTALTLAGLKDVSHDVDIIVRTANPKQFEDFSKRYNQVAKRLGIIEGEHGPFPEFDMSLLEMKDYFARAHPYQSIRLKRITILLMDIYDIVLSKLNRSIKRDIDDIKKLIATDLLSKNQLKQRYFELMRQQEDMEIRKHFVGKVETFFEKFGNKLQP